MRMERMNAYQISQDQRIQLVNRELDDAFVLHVENLPSKAWASMLLELNGEPDLMASVLKAKEQGYVTKEGQQDLLDAFVGQNPTIERLADVAESLGLKPADASDLATGAGRAVCRGFDRGRARCAAVAVVGAPPSMVDVTEIFPGSPHTHWSKRYLLAQLALGCR